MKRKAASISLAVGLLGLTAAPADAYYVNPQNCFPQTRTFYGSHGPYYVSGTRCWRYHTVIEKNQWGLVDGWYWTPSPNQRWYT